MKNIISNKIYQESGIWRLKGAQDIEYSDGIKHEVFLDKVLKSSIDLSSYSDELTNKAKDWTSEYHLSKKRAQLLNGFEFDKSSSVLEVGCGCGAITRYLGETFDEVVSVEGTFARAKLAKERTKDLNTINILNAPFQNLNFTKKFDIIICVGVFEYSSAFIDGKDPHDEALAYFSSLLKPDGSLFIAIENQFGLKYFSSGKEDHTNIMFDGIEGYPRYPNMARTFGKEELSKRVNKYFSSYNFYYPYPDYKIPSLILSENAFSKVSLAELISNFHSPRANQYFLEPLFDEKLNLLELEQNNNLEFFANSFLLVANKTSLSKIHFPQLGLFYSNDRLPGYQTKTIIKDEDEKVIIEKILLQSNSDNNYSNSELSIKSSLSEWIPGHSIELNLYKKSRINNISLTELFAPCKLWLDALYKVSDGKFLDGAYVDCIWRNSILKDKEIYFIDNEWTLNSKISIKAITIRSIFHFLISVRDLKDLTESLKSKSLYKSIVSIANALEIELTNEDFIEFYKLENIMGSKSNANDSSISLENYIKFTWFFDALSVLKKVPHRLKNYSISVLVRFKSILKRVFLIQ